MKSVELQKELLFVTGWALLGEKHHLANAFSSCLMYVPGAQQEHPRRFHEDTKVSY